MVSVNQATALARRNLKKKVEKRPTKKAEVINVVLSSLFSLIKFADKLVDVPGKIKKQWVMDRVTELLDTLLPMIPLPWFLQPFRKWLIEKTKKEILELTDLAIETILEEISG